MDRLIAAFDCGGSSSRLRIETQAGELVHEGKSGPCNWASTDRTVLKNHLATCAHGAPTGIEFALIGIAGLLTEKDRQDCEALVSEVLKGATVLSVPDYYASLAACNDDDAVCVVSGTGSLVCSFAEDNQVVKSGGGGPLIGDYGSGFWCGRVGLARFLMPGEQGAPPVLQGYFGANSASEAIAKIYAQPSPAAYTAKFGSAIALAATEGDEWAQGVIAESMQPLADLTILHMKAHGFPQRRYKVYCAGGFWQASHFVKKFFEVQLHLPTHEPPLTPLQGAMRLAHKYRSR